MCVFAIVVSALTATFADAQVPLRASTRFARPVVPGERLRVGFASERLDGGSAVRFRAESKAGTALRAGLLWTQSQP